MDLTIPGKCYLPVASYLNYTEAMDFCGTFNAHLAEPMNPTENAYIASIATATIFIGVSDGIAATDIADRT